MRTDDFRTSACRALGVGQLERLEVGGLTRELAAGRAAALTLLLGKSVCVGGLRHYDVGVEGMALIENRSLHTAMLPLW